MKGVIYKQSTAYQIQTQSQEKVSHLGAKKVINSKVTTVLVGIFMNKSLVKIFKGLDFD